MIVGADAGNYKATGKAMTTIDEANIYEKSCKIKAESALYNTPGRNSGACQ